MVRGGSRPMIKGIKAHSQERIFFFHRILVFDDETVKSGLLYNTLL